MSFHNMKTRRRLAYTTSPTGPDHNGQGTHLERMPRDYTGIGANTGHHLEKKAPLCTAHSHHIDPYPRNGPAVSLGIEKGSGKKKVSGP